MPQDNFEYKLFLNLNEEVVWHGRPLKKYMPKSRGILQFVLTFIIVIISIIVIATPAKHTFFINVGILLVVLVLGLMVVYFIIVEPRILQNMQKNTVFIVTNQRIITIINSKRRETKISKRMKIHIWDCENGRVTIGIDTKNQLFKWNYHPGVDYLFWEFELYPQYLYEIEYDAYEKTCVALQAYSKECKCQFI